ncbi:MAG: PH domain-containing protein [Clostridiales bacterium]|nr:PH domain-containing protein [Clostridiales bacterium]
MEYQGLSKKALSVLRVNAVIGMLFVIIAAGAAAVALYTMELKAAAIAVFAVLFVLAVLYIAIVPVFRHRRYKYLIADDRIEIIEGILFISRTIVPIDRIHQIDIRRGPIDTAFGVGKVIVTTAGSVARLRFLELKKAEEIAEQLNAIVRDKIRGGENK